MEVSYKKLWKILIDKDMKKKDLQAAARNQLGFGNQALEGRDGKHGSSNESVQNAEL